MRRLFLLLSLILWLPAPALRAETVAGRDDPAFAAAVALWLDADEAAALPRLATLAAGGNRAAQILLGIIDTTPAYQGDWLSRLPREERIALLRAPGGLSGRNWMRDAAADQPLAAAWLQVWDGAAEVSVMLDLARMGEARAANVAAKRLARREKRGFGAVAEDPAYPAFARALAIRDWDRDDPARARAARVALHPGDPGRQLLEEPVPDAATFAAWAATAPEGRHLAALVAALCPDPAAREADLGAALRVNGGWWGLAELGSPAAALIPEADWVGSPAALGSFREGLPSPPRGPSDSTGSACMDGLVAMMAEERRARRAPGPAAP